MAEDDKIGDPHHHDPDKFVHQQVGRPNAGYVEERLSKLEYYQRDLRLEMGQTKMALVEIDNNLPIWQNCKACNNALLNHQDGIQFPICDECLQNLGAVTKAKENWCFKE